VKARERGQRQRLPKLQDVFVAFLLAFFLISAVSPIFGVFTCMLENKMQLNRASAFKKKKSENKLNSFLSSIITFF